MDPIATTGLVKPPIDDEASEPDASSTADADEPEISLAESGYRRFAAWVGAVFALVSGSLVMLSPVLFSSVNADQRYLYLEAPGLTSGHWTRLVSIPWNDIPNQMHQGRLDWLTLIPQWVSYTGVTAVSVATGTPVAIVQGLQKIVLIVLCLGSVVAFAATLRGRTSSGRLVGLDRRALILIGAATTLLTAVGTQAQSQFRNGWTSYAVLTYGAVVGGFGVTALALWLTRRLALTPTRRWMILTVGAMIVIGVGLNCAYELYYLAFPVAVLAIVIQPVADKDHVQAERRAKVLVAGSLSASFAVAFVAVRIALSMTTTGTYVGVQPSIGARLFRTWWYNVASSVPGTGRSQAATDIATARLGGLPAPFASPLVFFCFLAAAGLVTIRLLLRTNDQSSTDEDETDKRRAQSFALLHGAVLALALALSSAAELSISVQAQELINTVGLPYRATVVTWVGLATAIVLGLVAIDLRLRDTQALTLWATVASAAALLGGVMLPANLAATKAENVRVSDQTVAAVYREVALGDPTISGDRRRCLTLDQVEQKVGGSPFTRNHIVRGAYLAYDYYHGQPFCSKKPMPPRVATDVGLL